MMLLVTASALTLSPNAVIVDYAKVTLALADEVAQVHCWTLYKKQVSNSRVAVAHPIDNT